jgi:cytosine/uracil/thiamine/allantoin permease
MEEIWKFIVLGCLMIVIFCIWMIAYLQGKSDGIKVMSKIVDKVILNIYGTKSDSNQQQEAAD